MISFNNKDYEDGIDKFVLTTRTGARALNFDDLTFSQSGSSTVITITGNNQTLAIVENTDVAELDATDFLAG